MNETPAAGKCHLFPALSTGKTIEFESKPWKAFITFEPRNISGDIHESVIFDQKEAHSSGHSSTEPVFMVNL